MSYLAGKAGKVLFFSVLTAMLLAVTAFASDVAIGAGCTTGSSLRLRSEPSTASSVVTMLDKSVAVAILDDSTDGWYKISYNGNTGYVSADYLNVDQDNLFTTYGRINSEGVNVRSGASTDSSMLATIEADAIVTVNGLVDGWYDVTCEYGTEGYIRSDYVDLTESSSSNGDIVDTAMQHLGTRYVYGGPLPAALTAPASPCISTASTTTPCPTPPPASGRAAWAPECTPFPSCSPAIWCSSMIPAATPARPAPMWEFMWGTASTSTLPLPAAAASSSVT